MGAKMFTNDDLLQSLLAVNEPLSHTVNYEHFSAQLLSEGVVLIEPRQAGDSDIVLSSGIHGNETAPIELCNQLLQQIFTGELLPKQRLLFIFGNPPAMRQTTRFVDENLNRLFCGSHQQGEQNLERQRAAELEQALVRFFHDAGRQRIHWDLHTAIRSSKHEKFAVCPYQPQRGYQQHTLAPLAAAGIEAFLFNHAPAFTFSYHSSHTFGADAFTVELGKVALFGDNDLSRLSALERVLRALIEQQPLAACDALTQAKFYQVKRVITREDEEFSFTFPDDTANFTSFTAGDAIAKNGNKTVFCDVTGEAVVFPNAKVAVGQRAALCVVPATLNDVCM